VTYLIEQKGGRFTCSLPDEYGAAIYSGTKHPDKYKIKGVFLEIKIMKRIINF